MKIYAAKDYADLSRKAANIISAQVIMKPNAVLGLATGSTPIGAYKQLIEWYEKGDIDFSHTLSINLDEYKGLSGDHDQSYRYFMNHNLFDHVNIKKENTNVPNGLAENAEEECKRYNNIIRSLGGIDLQLLGIGGGLLVDAFVPGLLRQLDEGQGVLVQGLQLIVGFHAGLELGGALQHLLALFHVVPEARLRRLAFQLGDLDAQLIDIEGLPKLPKLRLHALQL